MITALIPHYKNGRITAHTVCKLLQYGEGDVEIVVVDNSRDASIQYLRPFLNDITIVDYPKDRLQSHGIAFDYAIERGFVNTDYFICLESDCFPTNKFVGYYRSFIDKGYDIAGSILQLSGGQYIHPAASLYSLDLWMQAKSYCQNIEYWYFPNMAMKEGFACHTMIHDSILASVLENPDDWIELADGYRGLSKEDMLFKMTQYRPTVNPFHNGMGTRDESIRTYGMRNIETEKGFTLLDGKKKIIKRIGAEPGQWLSYYSYATNKNIGIIPIETKWLPNREWQQQEYTINEAGICHIWCGTSYLDMKESMPDVYEFKNNQVEELYQSLPSKYKI